MYRIESLDALVAELAKLPGIGPKSAMRLSYHLMQAPTHRLEDLERALRDVREKLRTCERCFNMTEQSPCAICRDPRRDTSLLCVVEEPMDLFAFEQSGSYRGLYHVLEGTLNPMRGIGQDKLRLRELIARVVLNEDEASPGSATGVIREVILAMNPSVDGEATAHYVARELTAVRPDLRLTRLGLGLPMGGDLEYADQMTLHKAIEGRRTIS